MSAPIGASPFSGTLRRHPWARPLLHGALIATALTFAFPLLWMLSTSLKPIDEVMRAPPQWIPGRVQWRNYAETIGYIPFWTYTANTLASCTLAALGTTLSSALVAYSFTRLEWRGRDL